MTSPPDRTRAVPAIALALMSLHLALAGRYGVFRDELYYVACGEHLDFGYVDHPPLVAVMARVARMLFGHSLYGLRLAPALCAAAAVLLAGELARSLRGGRFAQVVAAICVVVAPVYLGVDHFLSMNCVEPVAWCGAAVLAVRAVIDDRPRAWLGIGAVIGVGVLAKHSTVFFAVALVIGLLTTPQRRVLATRWPWLGAAIAAALVAPNVAWEVAHRWPTLEFMHNAQTKKMVHLGALAFFREVVVEMHPATLPVWIAGLGWLLVDRRARPARFLAVAFVVLAAFLAVGGGKPYYLAPAFPILFAAGGVALEAWVARSAARVAVVAALTLLGAVLAPLSIPLLQPEPMRRYAAALGVSFDSGEKHAQGPLPQHFADQFGWEAMEQRVLAIYRRLPEDERRVAAVMGDNYGEAGAIDFFGPRDGLPSAVSGHNAYFTWGPPGDGRGAVLIAIGGDREGFLVAFEEVERADETDAPYAMPYENHLPIWLCRRPKRPLAELWPLTKHYI